MTTEKEPTHIAYALKRETRVSGRWLEIGMARLEPNGKGGEVFLDRLPVGGFSGRVLLSPVGEKPAEPESHRPGAPPDSLDP